MQASQSQSGKRQRAARFLLAAPVAALCAATFVGPASAVNTPPGSPRAAVTPLEERRAAAAADVLRLERVVQDRLEHLRRVRTAQQDRVKRIQEVRGQQRSCNQRKQYGGSDAQHAQHELNHWNSDIANLEDQVRQWGDQADRAEVSLEQTREDLVEARQRLAAIEQQLHPAGQNNNNNNN